MGGLRWMVLAGVVTGSCAAAAYAGAPPLRPGESFYQFHGDVVLWRGAATSWGSGAFRIESVPDDRHDDVIVTRVVDARRLPPALSRWLGRELRLHGWDGSSCPAKIARFRLVGVAALVPPLATIWNGLHDAAQGDPATGDDGWQESSAMAEAAWNHGERLLVAEVDRPDGCAAAAWARDAELPAPVLAAGEPSSASLDQLAVETFRALPAWQHLQQRYATAPDRRGQPAPLWDRKDHARPRVQRFHLTSHGVERRLVSVYAVLDDLARRAIGACGPSSSSKVSPTTRRSGFATSRAAVPCRRAWTCRPWSTSATTDGSDSCTARRPATG